MKLYKVTSPAGTFDDGKVTVEATAQHLYCGSQNDARKARMKFEEQFKPLKSLKRPRVEIEEVNVPTDKPGLLAYLNDWSK